MNSQINELYGVAQQYAADSFINPEDYSEQMLEDAFKVIELVEDGKHEEALKVGLIY